MLRHGRHAAGGRASSRSCSTPRRRRCRRPRSACSTSEPGGRHAQRHHRAARRAAGPGDRRLRARRTRRQRRGAGLDPVATAASRDPLLPADGRRRAAAGDVRPRHRAAGCRRSSSPSACGACRRRAGCACVQRARLVHGGWLDEECEVWDSAGRLVAQARQLAGYREPMTRPSVDIDRRAGRSAASRTAATCCSTAVALALDETHPHPMAVSAHYVSSPDHGDADVEVERLRTGRRVASSRVRLAQDGAVRVEVLRAAGTLSDAPSRTGPPGACRPTLPPVEDCPRTPSVGPTGHHGRLPRPRRHADGPGHRAVGARQARRRTPRCAAGCAATTAPTPRCWTCWSSPTRCRR